MGMKTDYHTIKLDYLPNDNDDDEMVRIKEALNVLNGVELKIWITYAELGSYAAVGREYGVSTPTARTYVREIRDKILSKLKL